MTVVLRNLENLETNEADFAVESDFPSRKITKGKQRPDESISSESAEFPDKCKK